MADTKRERSIRAKLNFGHKLTVSDRDYLAKHPELGLTKKVRRATRDRQARTFLRRSGISAIQTPFGPLATILGIFGASGIEDTRD